MTPIDIFFGLAIFGAFLVVVGLGVALVCAVLLLLGGFEGVDLSNVGGE